MKRLHIFLKRKFSKEKQKVHHTWVFYSYPVLMAILYALLGVLFSPKGWYMGWIVFLTIPLFYTGVLAYNKKKPVIFCYPVLMLIIYLLGGFFLKLWHPLWIIFLTIPIFYIITARKKTNKDCTPKTKCLRSAFLIYFTGSRITQISAFFTPSR